LFDGERSGIMNKSVRIRKYVFNIQLSKLFSLEKKS